MKTVKQFLLAIAVVSFFFLTGCSTMQNIPYDGVYYSTTKGAPQNLASRNTNTTTTPTHYKVIKIQAINTSNNKNTASTKQNLQGYSIDTLRTDTISANKVDSVVYSNIKTNLGFDSPYFGTGIDSWSLGGYAGLFGYNNYWYNPYWSDLYFPYSSFYNNWYPSYYGFGGWGLYGGGFGYPYWGMYSFGYPYWGLGFGYPYYGGYYGFGYPYYYGLGLSPYYYGRHYRYFGHRGSILGGSRIPFGGGVTPYTKSTQAGNLKPSGIRPTSASENNGSNVVRRPAGSMRYQKALNEAKARGLVRNNKMIQKPAVYRSTEKSVVVPQYRRPVQGQRVQMSVPRYQKPKQYRSLDTRQVRSRNEYFRPQPQTIYRGRVLKTTTVRRAPQRFNIYRPNRGNSPVRYRPVQRNTWIRSTQSTPVRHYSPRFYTRPTYNNNNSFRNNNTYRAPVRINTGGGGGGGSRSNGGGGGHIR